VSLVVLSALRWPHDVHLLAIGTFGYTAASLGALARRYRWRGWSTWARVHGTGMVVSYIALLTRVLRRQRPQPAIVGPATAPDVLATADADRRAAVAACTAPNNGTHSVGDG
jgi:hypothetical protein